MKKQPHRTLLLPGMLLACIVLLSACGGSTTASKAAMPSATTALKLSPIDQSLQAQGQMQLQTFQQWITLMQQYHGDATTYQQQYNADTQTLAGAQTQATYQTALATVDKQVAQIQIPAMKAESQGLLQQLTQQVTAWDKTHTYHDSYNNTTYPLGYAYDSNGIESWAQSEITSSQTMADYQQTIENLNMWITDFKAFTQDSSDKTPYNQPHATDLQLLKADGKMQGKAVVVSLAEQTMRVYNNGQLVKAFLVTTGQPDLPSIPGNWWVEGKQSPTVFKSPDPPGSPNWYPNTPIHYAMQYHSDGYFVHDSWWRADYGPGTNFPHADTTGDIYSNNGSHGCVNMQLADAAWLYSFVKLYTPIIIY